MYLSKITLNVHHPGVRQALRDCNDMHRSLMCAFPLSAAQTPRSDIQVLYRLVLRPDEMYLLVESDIIPDEAALIKNGFALACPPKDISALERVFTEGAVFQFEVLCAPFKKVKGDGKHSRRVFLRTEYERREWLDRQAVKYGFSLLRVSEDGQSAICGYKRGERVHYDAIRFTGVLQIVNRELFISMYHKGIGPGKAYGLGMLTVARI